MEKALIMHETDNVAMVLHPTDVQTRVRISNQMSQQVFTLLSSMDSYHKFAVRTIPVETQIIKYGEVIGIATADIPIGAHVHTHNVRSIRV